MNYQGKKKALTFSFDDGVTQDKRLISILDKYGLKATFNLNSSLLGQKGCLEVNGKMIHHDKVFPSEVKSLYANHEVAVHTLTHPFLPDQEEETIAYQVNEDKKTLELLSGQKINGMAYPCGGKNNDDRVADVIARKTEMKFARTITSTLRFDLQKNLLRFDPTVHFVQVKELFALADEFLSAEPDHEILFYVWGHSYELDIENSLGWEGFEEFCKKVSGKKDIFYCTNSEALLSFSK